MRLILLIGGLIYGMSAWGQMHTGVFLSDGAGGTHSSNLSLSAYPAQKFAGKGQLGIYGVKQFQSGLQRGGMTAGVGAGSHFMVVGMERLGNGALNRDQLWGAYAVSVAKKTVLGIRVGVQSWSAKGYPSRRSYSVGIGWSSEITDRIFWKVQLEGLETFLNLRSSGVYLLRSAFYVEVSERVGLSAETLLEGGKAPAIVPGFHYSFDEKLYGRITAVSNLSSTGFAVGFRESNWVVEVSFLMHNSLGISGIISSYYKF